VTILFLDQYSDLGGAQRCLLDLLPAVLARGCRAVVAAPGMGPLEKEVRTLGAEYVPIRCGPFRSGRKSAADVIRFAWQTPLLAWKTARQTDAGVLFVNGPRVLPAAALAARSRPLVFHCHSRLDGSAARLAGRSLALARAVVAGSSRFALEPLMPYVPGEVVYNGVAPMPSRRFDERSFTAGVVGRVAPGKGQKEFVEAARVVLRRFPACRFIVCGGPLFGDGAAARYDSEMRALASDLPITFTGWLPDVEDVWNRLDLLVVPSTGFEATTRVILEAFAACVPVLASATGGIPEVVRDDENGFLVPPGDPEALAQRIIGIVEGGEPRLRAVATAGHRDWRERYTLEAYRRKMLAILEKAGGNART
jgi:glycosyltransferase involved in cell wall biosynthesis